MQFRITTLPLIALCCTVSVNSFAPTTTAPTSVQRHFPSSITSGSRLGLVVDTAIIEASSTAIIAATSSSPSSDAAANFFAGSAVVLGIVSAFKWNSPESSERIRESWEKVVESTSEFGTKPLEPSQLKIEKVSTPIQPAVTTTPVVTSSTTTAPPSEPVTPPAVVTSSTAIPKASDATSPRDLADMMKEVSDATTPKKKRFIVRLAKKVIMPWKKWKNL